MKVIFVCTGNTCRSPLAEGYLKSKNIEGLTVLSRGLFADGSPISENSLLVAREYGIDLSNHISTPFSSSDLDADRIICMSNGHRNTLISAGVDPDKISVLSNGISDPFGGDIFTYRICAKEIFSAIDNLVKDGFFDDISVRIAEEKDIPFIAEIEKECFSTPWSEDAIKESMEASTLFFVAQKADKIVGYIGISAVCGEGYITNIAVKEIYRNMGVGSKIIEKVLEFAKRENLEFVSLEVRKSNQTAIGLYKKYDFLEAGIRKIFYTNPQEDAIIMTRRF
jgi:ribosomal-protein-alanine N-acetyltransferase